MPWQSKAQMRWGHSKAGLKALGGPGSVSEWDSVTKDPTALPEKKDKIRHPGALTRTLRKVKRISNGAI